MEYDPSLGDVVPQVAPSAPAKTGMSKGAIAGIVVVILIVFTLIGVGIWLAVKKSSSSSTPTTTTPSTTTTPTTTTPSTTTTPTTTTPSTPTPSVPTTFWVYAGCFNDSANRAIGVNTNLGQVSTTGACQALAVAGGFNTFGVQNGGECRAGNYSPFNMYGAASGCSTLAGAWQNQVYQLITSGTTGAGFVAPTVTDPLNYGVSNGQSAQYSTYIGAAAGNATLTFWNPTNASSQIPTMGYQLLATWPYPVVVNTFSVAFESAPTDAVHGCKTVIVYNNSIAAGGTQVQSFPVPSPTAATVQTFKLSSPLTTSTLMLEFVPNGTWQVICSNLTFA